jgi:tripartite-type tricarboxylate transporter receptor subunit TctC
MIALTSLAAQAQDFPNRTIKLIVPTDAGGITDILACDAQGRHPAAIAAGIARMT